MGRWVDGWVYIEQSRVEQSRVDICITGSVLYCALSALGCVGLGWDRGTVQCDV